MSIRTNVALVCALLVSSYYVSVAQADLLDCLTATNSTVVSPSSSTYDTLRAVANQRVSKQPAFITLPNTAQAVSDIVKCCRQFNVSAVPRSGGHSYEGMLLALLTARHFCCCSPDLPERRPRTGISASLGAGRRSIHTFF